MTDLLTADECFLTGTGAELISVQQVGDKVFDLAGNPLTRQLHQGFMQMIESS